MTLSDEDWRTICTGVLRLGIEDGRGARREKTGESLASLFGKGMHEDWRKGHTSQLRHVYAAGFWHGSLARKEEES